jgi:hypothetical protein
MMMEQQAVTTEPTTKSARKSIPRRFLKGVLMVLWIFVLVWFLLEVFMRVGFDALPPETQGVIQHVRVVPWKNEHLIPVLPFIGSREFHARIPPGLKNYRVHWGDASFTFNTVAPWEGATEGFRTNPPEWPMDIVAVGDSFTFCWTAFEDCWVERLHEDFGWHVMNFGVPGTGSMAHRNVLGVYGPPMEPQIVLWQWYGNDFQDDYDYAVIRGEIEKPLNGPPPAAPPPNYGKLAEYSTVYTWLRDWIDKKINPLKTTKDLTPVVNGREISVADTLYSHELKYKTVQYGWNETIRAFEEGQDIVQDMNAQMVIILIPTKEETFAKYLTGTLDAAYLETLTQGRLRLLRTCDERGWRCIDMTPYFQEAVDAGQTVYNAFDFHLDASGNKIVSDVVANYLIDNELLEPRVN